MNIGGLDRTYLYHVPPNVPAKAPLLFVLHGGVADAPTIREVTGYEFDQLADQFGFIVVYPNGVQESWNECQKLLPVPARNLNLDDVGFVHALIEKFKSNYGIDTSRVFATGHSSGGHLAYRLALELPNEITAIAAVSAMLPVEGDNIC